VRIGKLNITWGIMLAKNEPAQFHYRWKDASGNTVYGETPPEFAQVSDPRYVLAAACKNYHVIPFDGEFEPGPRSICRRCGKRTYWCVAEELLERRPGFLPVNFVNEWRKYLNTDEAVRVKERKFYRWVK
jgi:hypothetical protein